MDKIVITCTFNLQLTRIYPYLRVGFDSNKIQFRICDLELPVELASDVCLSIRFLLVLLRLNLVVQRMSFKICIYESYVIQMQDYIYIF